MPSALKNASIIILVITLSCLSFFRNFIWYDNISLWKDVVQKSTSIRGYQNYGNAQIENGKNDEAVITYQAGLKIHPYDPEVHYNLARCYITKGSIDEAIHHFNESIKYFHAAIADARMSNYSSKIKTKLEKAYANLGSAYFLKGNTYAALNNYLLVLELNPNNALSLYNIGVIHLKNGTLEKARLYINKAHKIDPYNFPEELNAQDFSFK